VRLAVRPSTIVLVAFGFIVLVLGIWIEDRSAVAAPLVVLGTLIVVAAILFQGWAETISEVSVSQSGLTFKRQLPSTEDLTEAGLPPEAAHEIEQWMTALTEALPAAIDARVRKVLDERAAGDRRRRELLLQFMERHRPKAEPEGPSKAN
jgi:hypothetical protein